MAHPRPEVCTQSDPLGNRGLTRAHMKESGLETAQMGKYFYRPHRYRIPAAAAVVLGTVAQVAARRFLLHQRRQHGFGTLLLLAPVASYETSRSVSLAIIGRGSLLQHCVQLVAAGLVTRFKAGRW